MGWKSGGRVAKQDGVGTLTVYKTGVTVVSKELQSAQRQLKVVQWCIPVLSGAVIVMGAQHGEMQRATNVFKGLLQS